MPPTILLRRAARLLAAVVLAGPAALAQPVLVVETTPSGAAVWVDGLPVGEAPVRTRVAPGRHVLEARRRGFTPYRETVTVGDVDTLRVTLALDVESGRVRVEGLPDGATLLVDGARQDGPAADVATGRREVRVELPGGLAATARVPVELARTTTVRYVESGFTIRPVLQNALVPGAAQRADGRTRAGRAYGIGVVAAVGTGIVGGALAVAARGGLDDAEAEYQAARSEADALDAWAEVERQHAALARGETVLTVGAAAAALLYTASLADAALFHARRPTLEVGAPGVAWEVGPSAEGLAVRLRF